MLAERVQAHEVSIVRPKGYVQVGRGEGVVTVTNANLGKKHAIPGRGVSPRKLTPTFENR